MSLQANFPKDIPDATRLVGDVILSEDDVCYYLAHHIKEILSEEDFRAFYSATGRGGINPNTLLFLGIATSDLMNYLELTI